jgi:hypothetical protein
METADGGRIVAAESAGDVPEGAARWLLPAPAADGWTRHVLALADLAWTAAKTDRHALPIGRVKKISFGLIDGARGERLDIDDIAALRPNSNALDASGGKLVAGQIVSAAAKPVPNALVELVHANGTRVRTLSDQHGYYFFTKVPRGSLATLSVLHEDKSCAPRRGERVHIMKDEAEIDFNLAHCKSTSRADPPFQPPKPIRTSAGDR